VGLVRGLDVIPLSAEAEGLAILNELTPGGSLGTGVASRLGDSLPVEYDESVF
jgi:hypothetical protein